MHSTLFLGSFSIPFVQEAYRGCADAAELRRLDHLCHICTANHIARRASSRQVGWNETCAEVIFFDPYVRLKSGSASCCAVRTCVSATVST